VVSNEWFDMRELTYQDDFDLRLQRLGWHGFSYKSVYNDPEVIKQHWTHSPQTNKAYGPQGFFTRFGDTTFRKLLRTIYSRPRSLEELENIWSLKLLIDHLLYMEEQEIVICENGLWSKSPQYAHLHDTSRTLEWYIAEWFRSELKAPARHGVTIPEVGDGGDLDDIAFVADKPIMVECKSGDPANITEKHLEMFLLRVADFNPVIALFLIDTESKIDKQIEMIRKVYLNSSLVGPSSSKQLNLGCIQVRNVNKSIEKSLRATLHSNSTNSNHGRPLIGLTTQSAQLKKKTPDEHIAALRQRLEISANRPSKEQTMSVWMERVGTDSYHYCQDVFSGDSPVEKGHLTNCKLLVRKGLLMAEDDDGIKLGPFYWDPTTRYTARY
jgi:hypothetical protein